MLKSDDVPGYVYVATSNDLLDQDISKIGITKNIRARFATHRRNSSAHYNLFCFNCFRLSRFSDARRVETWVKRALRVETRKCDGRDDFFYICPDRMCAAIHESFEVLELEAIEQFPSEFEQILEKAGGFVSLPEQLLHSLAPNEARAYWQGVKDLLWTISKLDGVRINQEDFSSLWREADFNIGNNAPSAASSIAQHFRNHRIPEYREIGERLAKEIADRERDGFTFLPGDWLIEDWRNRKH